MPTQYAYHEVLAVGLLDRVRIIADDHLIAEHVRDWGSENVHYDPVHYRALLERKPNSLDFGKPFEAWDLPGAFGVLRRRLESDGDADGRREFIKVLRLLENHTVKELADAIDRALQIGAMTVDVIKILVQEGRESPAKLFRLDDRPHLQDHTIPEPQICKYSDLIQQPQSQHSPSEHRGELS